ncbi:hypothetical protein QQP08_012003, partial [Theobroma cacao]
ASRPGTGGGGFGQAGVVTTSFGVALFFSLSRVLFSYDSAPVSSPLVTCILIFQNLRVFGPGLNPFSPYCIANHSLASR